MPIWRFPDLYAYNFITTIKLPPQFKSNLNLDFIK